MPETSTNLYAFADETRRELDAAKENIGQFVRRLAGVDTVPALLDRFAQAASPAADLESLLCRYIVQHHFAIAWYDTRRQKEMRLHMCFVGISIALLVAVPTIPGLFVLGAQHVALGHDVPWGGVASQSAGFAYEAGTVIAALTAVLTGIMAVHKAVAGWLDKRRLVGRFWETSATLKRNLYAFEDQWRGKLHPQAIGNGEKPPLQDLIDGLNAGICAAGEIIDREQKEFFENFAVPSVEATGLMDLPALLGTARTSVGTLVKGAVDDAVQTQSAMVVELEKTLATKSMEVVKQDAEVNGLRAIVARRKAELERDAGSPKKESLTGELAEFEAKLHQAETAWTIADGQRASLVTQLAQAQRG